MRMSFFNGVKAMVMNERGGKKKKQRGFTLIEVLAVVAIIGILGLVAMPAYNNYATKSKFAEVTLATAPTKTAISACAVAGDCVSGVGSAAAINLLGPLSSAQTCSTSTQNVCSVQGYVSESYGAGCTYIPGGLAWYCTHNVCADQSVTTCSTTTTQSLISLPCVGASSAGCSPATKYAAAVSYDASGVVTATAVSGSGLKGETAVLTPSYQGGRVDWFLSGTCKTRAGGALC